ncbi:MAG: M23 family metallopeptidase [Ruminococcus sp.]|nr:M23 family metallopeptidase [Ruminococcus sp.]
MGSAVTGIFARFGLCTVKVICAVLLAAIAGVKFVFREMLSFLIDILHGALWLLKEATESIRARIKRNKELQLASRKAKKQGRGAYITSLLRFAGSFLFGEDGILYTAFNYMLPILSVAFLIGVVKLGSSYEYGIAVEFDGKEIGIIGAESDFEEAQREVQQRISYLSDDKTLDLSANFSLKIISDNDRLLSADQLANEMLAASDEELTEAYGIYIDGRFIGAVEDKDEVEEALSERLMNYHVDGNVREVSYKNKVEYTQGIYLASSVMDQKATIDMLTSSTEKKAVYVAQSGDTKVTVAQKYNMSLDKLEELNPKLGSKIKGGQVINVMETESYLPIQYVKDYETLSLLDYETVEIETSSLNVGMRAILVKGEKGERRSELEITYVDGIERSRKTIKSEVTKEPVLEQVGIGTYAARPDPGVRVLTGSGQFAWPVDGGWISDPFGSDRNHKGFDIAAPEGTDIYAAADGVVIAAGWNPGGYGYFVQIDHLDGYQTVYAHMSTVYATVDQQVTRGQLIGAVGTTGNSTGNHCHFEVRYMNICKDPELYLNTMDSYYLENIEESKKKDEEDDE